MDNDQDPDSPSGAGIPASTVDQPPFGDALPAHIPTIWFREQGGAIHWRCLRCESRLPITDGAGQLDALRRKSAVHTSCPGYATADQTSPPVRDQLGYVVRAGWIGWARRQAVPKPAWLVLYEGLAAEDRQADQDIGWEVVQWRLRTLIDWRHPEGPGGLSEGEVRRRLGLDRLAWRDLRDQLGLIQIEEISP